MSLTVAQARDEMSAILKDAMVAAGSPLSEILVLWDDTEKAPPDSVETPWIRFSIKHATGGQTTLSGANGQRRFTRTGTVVAQLFTVVGDGRSTSDALTTIIMSGYEDGSSAGGVWYRNARFNEIGLSGGWQQTNVLADFQYDEER